MTHHENPPSGEESLPIRIAEKILLAAPRYILLIMLLVTIFMMAAYGYFIGKDAVSLGWHIFGGEIEKAEMTIGVLEIVDAILIWSVVFLIVFGTMSNYVSADQEQTKFPPALQNMSSGKLKEKLSSSLITASAVYMFKIVVESTTSGTITLKEFAVIGPIHLLFIIGYFIIAHSNRNDPHSIHKAADQTTH